MHSISVLDTTLREGEQTPGVYFDRHIKTAIVDLLNRIGVDLIEAGHPAVTEEIHATVAQLGAMGGKARIGAHARSLRADVDMALDCGVGLIGVFYCVSQSRLEHHGKNIDTALAMIADTISYARQQAPDVLIRYTPEDAVRSSYNHVLLASRTAVEAGADIISIADTTGYLVPGTPRNMFDFLSRLKKDLRKLGFEPRFAVHCHNDRGLALANALDSIRAGAQIVDASVLGLGERAGIVDLASLLAVLSELPGNEDRWNLELVPELYSLVARFSGVQIPPHQPITGQNAFTHCAGVHTQAALTNPAHYESLSPQRFGRSTEICLDHMSGISALEHSLKMADIPIQSSGQLKALLKRIKHIGMKGRKVDLDELKHLVNSDSNQLVTSIN